MHDDTLFWVEFNKRFGEVNKIDNYRQKLRKLHQTKSVQDYLRDFQTYAAPLGYDERVLRDMFYDGLSAEIKGAMLMQDFDATDATTSFNDVSDRALHIDARLEAAKPSKNTTTNVAKSSREPNTVNTRPQQREKLEKGENVYMTGTDGKAAKGKIVNFTRNNMGRSTAVVQWNNGTTANVPFGALQKVTCPDIPSTSRALPQTPKDNKGPGPMDLDAAGKGKMTLTCNKCGGKGHMARACPTNSYSGFEARIEEVESGEEEESLKDNA